MLLCRSINYYSKRLGNVLETWVVTMEMDEPFYFPNYTQQHLSTLMPCTPSPIPSPAAHGRAGVAQPASPTCLGTAPSHPPQEHIPRPHHLSSPWVFPDSLQPTFWAFWWSQESWAAYRVIMCLGGANTIFIIFRIYFKLKILLKATLF